MDFYFHMAKRMRVMPKVKESPMCDLLRHFFFFLYSSVALDGPQVYSFTFRVTDKLGFPLAPNAARSYYKLLTYSKNLIN